MPALHGEDRIVFATPGDVVDEHWGFGDDARVVLKGRRPAEWPLHS